MRNIDSVRTRAGKVVIAILLLMTFLIQAIPGRASVNKHPLSITVECRENPDCIFSGEDIRLRIVIKNESNYPIGVPLQFIKKRGAYVKLVDVKTGKNFDLHVSLPPRPLRKVFDTLAPQESVELGRLITAAEIQRFGTDYIDLDVRVEFGAHIQVEGEPEPVDFAGWGTLKIIGKDTAALQKRNL
jgi:hypothetical protein